MLEFMNKISKPKVTMLRTNVIYNIDTEYPSVSLNMSL